MLHKKQRAALSHGQCQRGAQCHRVAIQRIVGLDHAECRRRRIDGQIAGNAPVDPEPLRLAAAPRGGQTPLNGFALLRHNLQRAGAYGQRMPRKFRATAFGQINRLHVCFDQRGPLVLAQMCPRGKDPVAHTRLVPGAHPTVDALTHNGRHGRKHNR